MLGLIFYMGYSLLYVDRILNVGIATISDLKSDSNAADRSSMKWFLDGKLSENKMQVSNITK